MMNSPQWLRPVLIGFGAVITVGSVGWALWANSQNQNVTHMATQAYLRGACQATALTTCEGTIVERAGQSGERRFRVVVGRVFALNNNPNAPPPESVLDRPCTGIGTAPTDTDGTCTFALSTPPASAPAATTGDADHNRTHNN